MATDYRIGTRFWLAGAAVVATVATAGSLYFSLGLGLIPCELCWYQRILMYPLVIVLIVATIEERVTIYRTALPLSLGCLTVAAYHSWIQRTASTSACGLSGGCGTIQYEIIGLSIPNLSLIASTLISLIMILLLRRTRFQQQLGSTFAAL